MGTVTSSIAGYSCLIQDLTNMCMQSWLACGFEIQQSLSHDRICNITHYYALADCRFVILVIGTVVYGRGDEQHVEATKSAVHPDHPHTRWAGQPHRFHLLPFANDALQTNELLCSARFMLVCCFVCAWCTRFPERSCLLKELVTQKTKSVVTTVWRV